MYVLDTNICIYIIKRRSISLAERFEKLKAGEIAISTVTLSELEYGIAKSLHQHRNREALEQFLIPIEILPFDEMASKCYGLIRANLEKRGLPIGSMDLMIAAHVLSLKVPLVTNNTREFSRVEGLELQDWTLD